MSHAAATYLRVPYTAPPNYNGTATLRAHRRHSCSSSTRPDKRTNARHRPSTRPKPKRRSHLKSVPAAKPPQQLPSGQKRPRKTTGHAPGPIPSGAATSRASRRRSRRSNTRQDKSAHARHRPRTRPNPKRHSQAKSVPVAKPPQRHPAGQKRPRETTGLNDCVRQDNPTHASLRA